MKQYLCIENGYWGDDPFQTICFTKGKVYREASFQGRGLTLIDDRHKDHGVYGGWQNKFVQKSILIPILWYKLKCIL